MRSKESVLQEIADLEAEHLRNEETWRSNMEEIEERQVTENNNRQMRVVSEADEDFIEARTPISQHSQQSSPSSPTSSAHSTTLIETTSVTTRTQTRSSRKRKRQSEAGESD